MRMWNVDIRKMCNQHLLGEHVEMHMCAGSLARGKSVQGFIDKGLMEIHNIKKRHDILSKEMLKRGMNHKSKIQDFKELNAGKVDIKKSEKELKKRCKDCKARFIN